MRLSGEEKRRSTYVRGISPDAANREKDDFYPTPDAATMALLSREQFDPDVWEPACGDGAISRIFEAAGHRVVSTDLVDRGYGEPRVDFLMESRLLAPHIVTNPPFKFESTPLARVHVASRRIEMSRAGNDNGGGGGGMIAFAWFVWDRAHEGAPSLGWFDWKDAA